MTRKIFVLTLVIGLIFLIAAPGAFAGKVFLRMASGTAGGSWYPIAASMMTILEKNIPNISTSNSPGAGVGNCKVVQRGETDLGWTYTHSAYDAYQGRGVFKKKHSKLRHLMSLYPGVFQMAVPRSSKIKTVSDLNDKRIVPGQVYMSSTAFAKTVLKAYGISFESIKKSGGNVSFVGYSDAVALMKDRHIDCFMPLTSCPQPALKNLNFRPGIRFLAIDSEHMKKVLEAEPGYMKTVIHKTAYEGMTEDVPTVGSVTAIIASADLSEEMAYNIVKVLQANLDEFVKVRKIMKNVKPENAVLGAGIPVHPGAMKYYKEKGIIK